MHSLPEKITMDQALLNCFLGGKRQFKEREEKANQKKKSGKKGGRESRTQAPYILLAEGGVPYNEKKGKETGHERNPSLQRKRPNQKKKGLLVLL